MIVHKNMLTGLAVVLISAAIHAENKPVGITPEMMSVDIHQNNEIVQIVRNQDNTAMIDKDYAKTSRPCPPFCIQPMIYTPGVETLGELEVIDYVVRMQEGENILVIDSRTPDWLERGTIPGAVNVPFTELTPSKGATTEGIMKVMLDQFGVSLKGDADEFAVDEAIVVGTAVNKVFDYSNAKTLVLFCNGMWCGQSTASMAALIKFGYPKDKLKWFRGGMQTWNILGLSTTER
jgi:rhodanese-related sulfurtransferase